ncbi:hypothetical protein F8388_004479 [Cannabis sativa]|uniref:Uncharacterized protein n=1 Tax=Cannabis sativa TaxID=3483 RepID=A0A7J6ENE0_CANSA|nr:hypothetical protein F8388_004479 [Cannabis sativa]
MYTSDAGPRKKISGQQIQGWKGSASVTRVLRDAIKRQNDLKIPKEYVATFKSIDGEIPEAFVTRVLRKAKSKLESIFGLESHMPFFLNI